MPSRSARLFAIALTACGLSASAEGAENGIGFYVLGSRVPGAGFTPPPGAYFQNDLYLYSASTSTKNGTVGTEAQALVDLPTLLLVTSGELFGGQIGLTITPPFGALNVKTFAGSFSQEDNVSVFGDPVVASFLGWHAGNWHWQTGVAVNMPIGDYEQDSIANIAFHRWAADVYANLTWLNPGNGWQIDNSLGFTFNGENPEIDYRTGTEFHWEGAVTKNLPRGISVGIAGYFYDQITGDSGSGAVLGPFEGQTAALGAILGYTFIANSVPVTIRLKYFHEFDTVNRLQADTGLVTLAFPLSVAR